jgi:hypothetical protein
MVRLLCEPEDRIGSTTGLASLVSSGTLRSATWRTGYGSGGLDRDGAEELMCHPWFDGIDWNSELHAIGLLFGSNIASM